MNIDSHPVVPQMIAYPMGSSDNRISALSRPVFHARGGGENHEFTGDNMAYRLIRFLDRLLVQALTRLEVQGLERIPKTGTFIAVGNHLGVLDPVLVYYLLDRRDIIMLVAEKYHRYALARWLVKSVDAIYVERFSADFAVMREVLARLKAGGALIIAPEGTCSKTGGLQMGRLGAAYLAAKAQVPVLPVAVIGTEDKKLIASLKRLRRAPVTIRVGRIFYLPPLPRDNREQALQRYTDEIMCQIASLLPPEYRGIYADHPRLMEILQDH